MGVPHNGHQGFPQDVSPWGPMSYRKQSPLGDHPGVPPRGVANRGNQICSPNVFPNGRSTWASTKGYQQGMSPNVWFPKGVTEGATEWELRRWVPQEVPTSRVNKVLSPKWGPITGYHKAGPPRAVLQWGFPKRSSKFFPQRLSAKGVPPRVVPKGWSPNWVPHVGPVLGSPIWGPPNVFPQVWCPKVGLKIDVPQGDHQGSSLEGVYTWVFSQGGSGKGFPKAVPEGESLIWCSRKAVSQGASRKGETQVQCPQWGFHQGGSHEGCPSTEFLLGAPKWSSRCCATDVPHAGSPAGFPQVDPQKGVLQQFPARVVCQCFSLKVVPPSLPPSFSQKGVPQGGSTKWAPQGLSDGVPQGVPPNGFSETVASMYVPKTGLPRGVTKWVSVRAVKQSALPKICPARRPQVGVPHG